MIPLEIIINIYNFCNYETRININRAFNWDYSYINPYKDYSFSYSHKKDALVYLIRSIFEKSHPGAFFTPSDEDLDEENGLVFFKPYAVFDFGRKSDIKDKK